MVTVQMTMDEKLVKRVDDLAHKLRTSRSAFAREALKEALKKHQVLELEEKHKNGYLRHPVKKGEFDIFEDEHAWGDA
ncbi:MAG: ribbon-helix-helix domain-containing protein [Candidatus Omnitrophota bacterium]|nr:ribbon-helix-helix domain-containing protein [Candidatus Omnitrophota bacterium]